MSNERVKKIIKKDRIKALNQKLQSFLAWMNNSLIEFLIINNKYLVFLGLLRHFHFIVEKNLHKILGARVMEVSSTLAILLIRCTV